MATYTPGPWERRSIPGHLFELHNAAGEVVLRIRGGMMPSVEDARVLEAAPELLDVVRALLALQNRLWQDVNWGASNLRAETIAALNEVPGQARALLDRIAGQA